MFRYEVLFLTVPEITKDESEAIKAHFTKVIRAHKGTMVSFDRWGKYRLAYPVNKNEYGVYFLTRFEVEGDQKEALLAAIKEIFVFKFNTLIPKHIVIPVHALSPSMANFYSISIIINPVIMILLSLLIILEKKDKCEN